MSKTAVAMMMGALVVMAGTPALAEILHWTDESGVARYTNQSASVPAEARGLVGRLDTDSHSVQRIDASPLRTALRGRKAGSLVEVPFQRDGELMRVEVRINDSLIVPFYLDTAATGVSIPSSVARALGVAGEARLRTTTAHTAGGPASLGVVDLDMLDLGGARLRGIEGTVNPHLDVGLLGGAFLNQFNYLVDTEGGVILFEQIGEGDVPNDR